MLQVIPRFCSLLAPLLHPSASPFPTACSKNNSKELAPETHTHHTEHTHTTYTAHTTYRTEHTQHMHTAHTTQNSTDNTHSTYTTRAQHTHREHTEQSTDKHRAQSTHNTCLHAFPEGFSKLRSVLIKYELCR